MCRSLCLHCLENLLVTARGYEYRYGRCDEHRHCRWSSAVDDPKCPATKQPSCSFFRQHRCHFTIMMGDDLTKEEEQQQHSNNNNNNSGGSSCDNNSNNSDEETFLPSDNNEPKKKSGDSCSMDHDYNLENTSSSSIVHEVYSTDVLLGRGKSNANHLGNRNFRGTMPCVCPGVSRISLRNITHRCLWLTPTLFYTITSSLSRNCCFVQWRILQCYNAQ